MSKKPTTFEELGMTFIKDSDCPNCPTGNCHNRATGVKDGIEYFIYVNVQQEFCDGDCENPKFEIDVSMNSSTFSGNDLGGTFTKETEAIDYLQTTFVDFKCSSQ